MAEETNKKPKKKKLYKRLINKYRLVIMNEDTYEEKSSLTLSPMNVITVFGSLILFFVVFTTYLIAFTPLKEYIPGYPDGRTQRQYLAQLQRADSLEKVISQQSLYLKNINSIISGKDPLPLTGEPIDTTPARLEEMDMTISEEDSMLRARVERESRYNLYSYTGNEEQSQAAVSSFFFFTPLKGDITARFNPMEKHYGIDIVAPKNEPIKAALDGTVVFSSWTSDTGYVIGIQHENNIISMYKHNSVLLKKTGAYVKAGDVIAIVGNSGELSTGPHLHFELWYNMQPLDPEEYMVF